MTEPPAKHWESQPSRGPRPIVLLMVVFLVVVAACAGVFIIGFTSPGFKVAQAIYAGSPDIVTQAHYASVAGQADVLTIMVARDVTRDEALTLQCRTIVPLMVREHVSALVVIQHPDGRFRLEGAPCPTAVP